ncbi:MAG: aminopeptidase [Candidatus Aenigmarchaeota archaeon]|nr:aminopeptidase [Candidatus Aenigmarchaeota archaeon]
MEKLKNSMISKKFEKKINFIHDVKKFAEDLGIEFDGSFEDVVLDEKYFYWVIVSERNSLNPPEDYGIGYLFFKDKKEDAERFKDYLNEEGYDSMVYRAEAYGRGKCPITKALLESSKERISYAVIHEGFHDHLKVKNVKIPLEVEEPLADYVGLMGSLMFFKKEGLDTRRVRSGIEEYNLFSGFVNKYHDLLEEYYEKNESGHDGEKILEAARNKLSSLKGRLKNLDAAFKFPINNAFFFYFRNYTKNWPIVREYMKNVGIKRLLNDTEKVSEEILDMDGIWIYQER